MTTKMNAPVQYLPAPTQDFWEALRVVRNYLLHNRAEEVFADPAAQFRGEHNLTTALAIVDHHLYMNDCEEDSYCDVE